MAELAGDDAALVDPTDVESIRDGIARAQRPTPRRGRELGARSRERTRAVYEELA